MTTCKRVLALGGCMLLGAASVAQADATQGNNVQAELAAMRARIAQLEGQQSQGWLNERRAEEVKSLVREVLSDADTRASMQEGGINAGYNNGFFIASEDGRFLLNVGGQVQFRYTYNVREGDQGGVGQDKNDGSFSTPRTKIFLDGHVGDPRIQYHIVAESINTGGFGLEEYKLSYELADGLTIWGGLVKTPIIREDLIDSRYMLMADRGAFSNFFSYGRWEGLGVTWDATDAIRVQGQLVDNVNTEFGVFGRADFKLAGDWDQAKDFTAWHGEGQSMILGVAAAYLEGAHGVGNGFNYSTTASVDFTYENEGWSFYAAAVADNNKGPAGSNQTYGIVGQASYNFDDKYEPFVRYEYINYHDKAAGSTDLSLATAGVNYYVNKHAAKFTLDVQYGLRSMNPALTAGMLGDIPDNRNQVAVRAQFQLLF